MKKKNLAELLATKKPTARERKKIDAWVDAQRAPEIKRDARGRRVLLTSFDEADDKVAYSIACIKLAMEHEQSAAEVRRLSREICDLYERRLHILRAQPSIVGGKGGRPQTTVLAFEQYRAEYAARYAKTRSHRNAARFIRVKHKLRGSAASVDSQLSRYFREHPAP